VGRGVRAGGGGGGGGDGGSGSGGAGGGGGWGSKKDVGGGGGGGVPLLFFLFFFFVVLSGLRIGEDEEVLLRAAIDGRVDRLSPLPPAGTAKACHLEPSGIAFFIAL